MRSRVALPPGRSFIANAKRYYADTDELVEAENVQAAVRNALGRKKAAQAWAKFRRRGGDGSWPRRSWRFWRRRKRAIV